MLRDERLSCLFLLSHPYFLAVLSLTGFPSSTWLCHPCGYRCHFIHILCSTTFQAIHFCKELFNEKNRPSNDDTTIIGQLLRIPQNDLSVEEVINTMATNITMMVSFLLPSSHPPTTRQSWWRCLQQVPHITIQPAAQATGSRHNWSMSYRSSSHHSRHSFYSVNRCLVQNRQQHDRSWWEVVILMTLPLKKE